MEPSERGNYLKRVSPRIAFAGRACRVRSDGMRDNKAESFTAQLVDFCVLGAQSCSAIGAPAFRGA